MDTATLGTLAIMFGIGGWFLAKSRGTSPTMGAVVSFLLGPLGLLAVLVTDKRPQCAACRKRVPFDARKCAACGESLTAERSTPARRPAPTL